MSTDYWSDSEEWLGTQGVKIVGRHTLRYADTLHRSMPEPEAFRAYSQEFKTREEPVYVVEMHASTVKQFHAMAKRMEYTVGTSMIRESPWENPDSWLAEWRNHQKLLSTNEMYREAWKEFQSIRALIGETPHWP